MAKINSVIFNQPLGELTLWDMVNTMALTFLQFAQGTHYYSRMYGVITDKDEGIKQQDERINFKSFIPNNCVRDALYRILFQVQESTEGYIGYNITPRYHYEEVNFPFKGKWQTDWPGIERMNVRPVWTVIDSLQAVPLSPYVVEGAAVTPGSPPIVEFSQALVPNPKQVFLRNRLVDHGAYTMSDIPPVRNGSDWQVGLNTQVKNWNPGDDVSVQSREWAAVTIPTPAPPVGSTLYAVYPGTNQIIPFARDPITSGGDTTYFFYIYSLIDPAFYLEEPAADLVKAEFWKLMPTIQFKYLSETTTPFEVVWGADTDEFVFTLPDDPIETRIVDGQRGVVQTLWGEDLFTWEKFREVFPDLGCHKDQFPNQSVKLRYYYKTNPNYLKERLLNQVNSVREAILYRVAAELPMKDCGCEVSEGFIAAQQEMMAAVVINKVLGMEEHHFRYGQLLGQQRYESIIKSALKHQRLVKV